MIRNNESQIGRLSTAELFSEADTTKGLAAPTANPSEHLASPGLLAALL